MAQRNTGRIDRFAQMSKQEEIIAKKRQEILEKQRTAQLAKAVAAAQTLAAKMKGGCDTTTTTAAAAVEETAVASTTTSAAATAAAAAKSDETVEEGKSDPQNNKKDETIIVLEATKHTNSLTSKTGKISFGIKRNQALIPMTEQPPPKILNSFCNDGSFLDHFKKILEKHEQPKPPPVVVVTEAVAVTVPSPTTTNDTNSMASSEFGGGASAEQATIQSNVLLAAPPPLQQHQHQSTLPPPLTQTTTVISPPPPQYVHMHTAAQHQHQQSSIPSQHQPPPSHALSAAFFTTSPHASMFAMPTVAPPPPPPPPQLPLALANLAPLYMIPAPEPLQLNAIPAPKEFDLNAIPKPQINLEAIQVPIAAATAASVATNETQQQQIEQQQQQLQQQQQQQHQQLQSQHQQLQSQHQQLQPQHQQLQAQHQQLQLQHQQLQPQHQQLQPQQVFSDNNDHSCIQLPTTIENLIDLVADNGDVYEDKIRSHKNELHPAMWFLFDKSCEQYYKYQQQLNGRRQQHLYNQQQQQQRQHQHQQQQQQQNSNSLQRKQLGNSIAGAVAAATTTAAAITASLNFDEFRAQQEIAVTTQAPPSFSHGDGGGGGVAAAANASSSSQHGHDAADKYDPESVISGDVDSDDEYMRGMMDRNRDNIKRRIECRNELSEEERQEREAEAEEEERRRQEKKKLRKSRWGEKIAAMENASASSGGAANSSFGNQNKPMLSTVTRTDPALLSYARLNYGSINLSEEDWKKCEEHYKVNLLYQDMMRKRQEIDRLARNGKFKYEYDSDEDVDGGTWEHKLRCAEMEATQAWASALTKQSEGKHHIGDFLPPEELKKFMEQYEAKKNNRQPDLSDYKEYKLKEDNIGFKMLQKLGWKEGQGLGTDGAGIVDPVNKAPQRDGNQGLGVSSAATPEDCDNEYDAYRKRMMLAYRFRPNPLNNPRRAYY